MALTDHTPDARTPAQQIANLVRNSIPRQADQIERAYKLNYERIWNTPGVDPVDVLAELGPAAGPIFALTNQIMYLARPAALMSIPSKYTYVVNEDGTITLTLVVQPDEPADEPPAPEVQA